MYQDPKSKISQLEKVLDAREDKVSNKAKRHELHDHESTVDQDWDHKEFGARAVGQEIDAPVSFSGGLVGDEEEIKKKKSASFSLKVLIGSLIFFVLALAVVSYEFLGGRNIVSGNNIEINVKAPISVAGGEALPFEIEIKNNNNVKLLGVDLGVTFPAGTQQAEDTALTAKRVQEFVGDIKPGHSVKKNLNVILFGTENEKKDINITLEYKVEGSNSQFNKNKVVTILISSSPVSIIVKGPKEVNTNQAVDYTVEVTSNSPSLLKNLLLKAEYPFGFSFVNSSPNYFSKNTLWLIGDLAPGATRIIKISGVVTGQELEERGFNFTVGTQSKDDIQAIDTPFISSFTALTIRRPFVSADVFLNDETTTEYVSAAGSKVEGIIRWQNNLPYQVSDVSILVKINGNALDKSSVRVAGGFYRSFDNTIIFDKTTDSDFRDLGPGEGGESTFEFSSFSAGSVTGSSLSNPTISLDISVKGRRTDFGNASENILFTDSRKVRVTAAPRLFAKALYYIGPFQNKGPIPPRVEQETTYTVTWTVTNPLNNLSSTRVSAVLPPYISWLAKISPDNEKVSYNDDTREVVWNVGNVLAGTGSLSAPREVSFQVSFLPSASQVNSSPNLIGSATLTARDTFTSTGVSSAFEALDTVLNSDPYFQVNYETVRP